jgi:hypothetical protein
MSIRHWCALVDSRHMDRVGSQTTERTVPFLFQVPNARAI